MNEENIRSYLLREISDLFSSLHPQSSANLESLFYEVIFEHENNMLFSILIDVEILRALKGRHPIKVPSLDGMLAFFYQ